MPSSYEEIIWDGKNVERHGGLELRMPKLAFGAGWRLKKEFG